ncbi:MAG: tyrosine-type recombinase/integrase [Candidatus Acidiferrales bacterium]
MFGVAVSWNYLEDNPARGVKLPPRQLRRERQFLTPDQVRWLLGVLPEPMKTMVLVAVLSGLRVGEVLALRWKHLDLLRGTIHVRESVYEGRFSPPKTVSSRRSVPMSRVLKQVLLAHRSRLQRVAPDDLVFATKRGTAFSSKNLHRRVLLPGCDTAGVPRVGWHAFRHTHATLLSELGESIKTAQAQLGHSSLQTTLEVYTHAVPETQRAAVERLEHLLLGGQLDPNGPKFPVLEEAGSGRVQ